MFRSLLLLCVSVFFLSANTRVIELSEEVDYGMVHLVKRGLENNDGVEQIVFQINTFGGDLMAAFEIGDMIHATKTPTVAVVDGKAISAGALIAISCDSIVMIEGSTIGDCAPIMQTNEGIEMLGEKIQSPLRAKFRVYAEASGYSKKLAEAMVSIDLEVFEVITKDSTFYVDSVQLPYLKDIKNAEIRPIVKKGVLLTMSDDEAHTLGFSKKTVASLAAYLEEISGSAVAHETFERSWSEWFVNFIGVFAGILLLIGIGAIYIESKAPGIGVPGVIGVVALFLVFAGQSMAGLADHTEILLLVLGLVLLAAEVFVIPGFGVVGIAGIGCIAVAGILSMQNFVLPSPDMPWQQAVFTHNLKMVGGALVGAVILIVVFFWMIFPKLGRATPGSILTAELSAESVFQEQKKVSVGAKGVVTKPCRPVGSVKVDGEVYGAIVEGGGFLDKGATVVVRGTQGAELVIREEVQA